MSDSEEFFFKIHPLRIASEVPNENQLPSLKNNGPGAANWADQYPVLFIEAPNEPQRKRKPNKRKRTKR